MKKRIFLIFIIILFVLIIAFIFNFFKKKYIIAEYSRENFAGKFVYNGIVICSDGSIYKFSLDDKLNDYDKAANESLNKLNSLIMKNTTEFIGKISEDELNTLKKYSPDIDSSNYKKGDMGFRDFGQTSTTIWNYDLNERIILSSTGDGYITNLSENADVLRNIIKSYANS